MLVFVPPIAMTVDPRPSPIVRFPGEAAMRRLCEFHALGPRGINVYKLTDGTFTNVQPQDPALIDKFYMGGSAGYPLTQPEADDLIAAGYTVTEI